MPPASDWPLNPLAGAVPTVSVVGKLPIARMSLPPEEDEFDETLICELAPTIIEPAAVFVLLIVKSPLVTLSIESAAKVKLVPPEVMLALPLLAVIRLTDMDCEESTETDLPDTIKLAPKLPCDAVSILLVAAVSVSPWAPDNVPVPLMVKLEVLTTESIPLCVETTPELLKLAVFMDKAF